jgi:hypothetical protein
MRYGSQDTNGERRNLKLGDFFRRCEITAALIRQAPERVEAPRSARATEGGSRNEYPTIIEVRASGVRSLLIYCSDFRCSHSTSINSD